MALISRPSIPEIIFERIKSDQIGFAFNFFQDGQSLDVSARDYKIRLKAGGISILLLDPDANAAGRVTFSITSLKKISLTGSEYQISLVEVLEGDSEKTIMMGTLRWSVAVGKSTGLQDAPDVSINYIAATQELMIALGVVDFGSLSSAANAASAAESATLVLEVQEDLAVKHTEMTALTQQVIQTSETVAADKIQINEDKIAAELAKNQAQSISDEINQLGVNGFKIQDEWNPATATPNLAGLGLTNAAGDKGKLWIVNVPGSSSVTGAPITYSAGDGVFWNGTKFVYAKKSDLAYSQVQEINKVIVNRSFDEYALPVTDKKRRNLGGWLKDGSFEPTKYSGNPIIPGSALKDGEVDISKLAAAVIKQMWSILPRETGFIGAFLDAKRRIIWAIRLDGTLFIPKLSFTIGTIPANSIPANAVTNETLTPDVKSRMWTSLSADTGFVGGFLDSKRRILWAIRLDGTFYAPKMAISIDNFSPASKGVLVPWYYGLKLVTLGDSITRGLTWQPELARLTGMVFNSSEVTSATKPTGFGGSMIIPNITGSTGQAATQSIYFRADYVKDYSPDIIILGGGQNDGRLASYNLADAAYTGPELPSGDPAMPSFVSSYKGTLVKLISQNLAAKIYIITPHYTGTAVYTDAVLADFKRRNDAIKAIGEMYSVKVIDMVAELGINPINNTTFIADGIHPNADGGIRMARTIVSRL